MNWLSNLKNNWQQRGLTRPELANMFALPKDGEWVAIDCEMTGLNPKKHHVLSIAAIHINNNNIDSGNGLDLVCKPPIMPEEDTIVIHGLRPQDVAHGISYEQMLEIVLPFIGNRPIVGFCPQIDMAFLNPLTKKYMGTTLPNKVIDIRSLHNQKTGNKASTLNHKELTFDKIMQAYNVPKLGNHDAYNDALMTAMAFMHLK